VFIFKTNTHIQDFELRSYLIFYYLMKHNYLQAFSRVHSKQSKVLPMLLFLTNCGNGTFLKMWARTGKEKVFVSFLSHELLRKKHLIMHFNLRAELPKEHPFLAAPALIFSPSPCPFGYRLHASNLINLHKICNTAKVCQPTNTDRHINTHKAWRSHMWRNGRSYNAWHIKSVGVC